MVSVLMWQMYKILTQSPSHPWVVQQVGRPEPCDAFPAGSRSPHCWQTLVLQGKQHGVKEGNTGRNRNVPWHRETSNRCLWPVMELLQAAVILNTGLKLGWRDLQKEKNEAVQHEEAKTSDDTSTVCNKKQHKKPQTWNKRENAKKQKHGLICKNW